MPQLRPFHGIRYSSASEISDLVCPPYDVISGEEQAQLHDRHPHNAVRLELPRGGAERYEDADRTFREWFSAGTLMRDDPESFYVYRQDFVAPTGDRRSATGIIGALELQPFGPSSGVLPHERTMAGPKKDRLALMQACPVNVSPIYGIYRGEGSLDGFFSSLGSRPPELRFQDEAGTLHRLWRITARGEIGLLGDVLADRQLVIADGHHRYETALSFHGLMAGRPGEHGAIMCFCVDADTAGLVVLPYNRLVRTRASAAEIERVLEGDFGARPAAPDDPAPAAGAAHSFSFVFRDRTLEVGLAADEVERALAGRAPAWRALDVVVLHEVIMPRLPLGEIELRFTKEPEEVRAAVEAGEATMGVLLRPLSAVDVVEVARANERMPQKASYFWPKVPTGLVFRPLGPPESPPSRPAEAGRTRGTG